MFAHDMKEMSTREARWWPVQCNVIITYKHAKEASPFFHMASLPGIWEKHRKREIETVQRSLLHMSILTSKVSVATCRQKCKTKCLQSEFTSSKFGQANFKNGLYFIIKTLFGGQMITQTVWQSLSIHISGHQFESRKPRRTTERFGWLSLVRTSVRLDNVLIGSSDDIVRSTRYDLKDQVTISTQQYARKHKSFSGYRTFWQGLEQEAVITAKSETSLLDVKNIAQRSASKSSPSVDPFVQPTCHPRYGYLDGSIAKEEQ